MHANLDETSALGRGAQPADAARKDKMNLIESKGKLFISNTAPQPCGLHLGSKPA
jgi:hypothetical protein